MKEIGEKLMTARLARGITLEQAQAVTKIRSRYLKALEEGDVDAIPGEVYYKGFLRSYGNYLGLDGLALVEEYKKRKGEQAPLPEETPVYPVPRKNSAPGWTWVIVPLILIAVAAWFVKSRTPAMRPPELSGNVPAVVETEDNPGTTEDIETKVPGTPERPEVQRQDPDEFSTVFTLAESPLNVRVKANDRCWVYVTGDGKPLLETTLEPGDERVFEVEKELVIRAGRPWALTLTLNDRALGAGGVVGPVKNLIFRSLQE
ncbi:MAG: RodZ domain-containing protein [Bacillota bacterium]